jgi:hypothetical protein
VPTLLGIQPETQEFSFGHAVSPEDERLGLFKLLFVNQDHLPETVRTSPLFQSPHGKSADLGKTAKDLVTIYLKLLWQHFVKLAPFSEKEQREMQLIITIPAGWPDSVHADMTTAIRDADILTLASGRNPIFIREPQAAARAMIRELRENRCQGMYHNG